MSPSSLPLLHDGDSFILELQEEGERVVRLCRILRYENNQNMIASDTSFFDLPAHCREAVRHSIQRRYHGRTLKL